VAEPAAGRTNVMRGGLALLAPCIAYGRSDLPGARVDVAAYVRVFAVVARGDCPALRRGWMFMLPCAFVAWRRHTAR